VRAEGWGRTGLGLRAGPDRVSGAGADRASGAGADRVSGAGPGERLGEVEGEAEAVQGVGAQVVFALGGERGDDLGY